MHIYLKEKIGNPELFTGRKKELAYFGDWIRRIKREISKSTAILSRRKTGKSALLQRLYNLTFHENNGIVPFYFEILETEQWWGAFCENFFLTFIYQYIAFKTRKTEYLSIITKRNFQQALEICQKEKLDYLNNLIESVQERYVQEDIENMWQIAREAPRKVAEYTDERIVQFIDEFQFINRFIYKNKDYTHRLNTLAGTYLHTAEYKNAPLLVSGSWVGWLMDDLTHLLPGRFRYYPLEPMPEDEAIEMIFKYSLIEEIPVTEKTAYLIAQLTEGNPFYISALFHSLFPGRDLTTAEGVRKTLEYETLNFNGEINITWMEYIDSAFPRINAVYAKDMVLYLSKHRHRRVGRKELKQALNLDMSDVELEKKFKALFKSDIIEEHAGSYRGVQDNIFDKVFRRSYAEDIDKFMTEEAPHEYKQLFEDLLEKYKKLSGEYNRYKGAFAEFMIAYHFRSSVGRDAVRFASLFENLPEDFSFSDYETVWSYTSPPLHKPEFQIDVFARARKGTASTSSGQDSGQAYSLIGEVKHRKAKYSLKEAEAFREKAVALMNLEGIRKALLFVFSSGGFYENTLAYFTQHQIAWTDDPAWITYQPMD